MSQSQQPRKAATERRVDILVRSRSIIRQFHRLNRLFRPGTIMPHKRWALLLAALLLSVSPPGRAEGGSHWRIYPLTAGRGGTFAVAVTVSPRGNVWVRQGGDGPVSWLDGFQVRTIPFSGTGNFPVYESRSGQIWALFAGGVMEFRRDQWVQYPVAEISAEIQSSALRYVHPFPLLPAERDHVLALLPDRLLEYDAGQGRTIVLRKVGETRLGRFNELDGVLWVLTRSTLFKRERNEWEPVAVPALRAAQYSDVATEPNGVFWLATTEGVVRHALKTWRAPPELAEINMPARSMIEDGEGGLWISGAGALIDLRNGQRQMFPWPQGFQPASASSGPLFRLRDGQIVSSAAGGALLFDPRTQSFSPIDPPAGWRIQAFLGKFRDGRLCAQTVEPDSPGHFRLEVFDGRSFSLFFEPTPDWSLGDEIFFLQAGEDGALRLGTGLGLGVWDEKAKTFLPVKEFRGNRAVGLLETGKGKIWCTSGEVIYECNGKTWVAVQTGLGQVNAMLKARDGSVWVASNRGLHRF